MSRHTRVVTFPSASSSRPCRGRPNWRNPNDAGINSNQHFEVFGHVVIGKGDLFRAAIETLPAEQLRMFITEYQGNLVANRLILYFGQQVTNWYAVALRILGITAMSSILWELTRDASEGGFQVFDCSGAGCEVKAMARRDLSFNSVPE